MLGTLVWGILIVYVGAILGFDFVTSFMAGCGFVLLSALIPRTRINERGERVCASCNGRGQVYVPAQRPAYIARWARCGGCKGSGR